MDRYANPPHQKVIKLCVYVYNGNGSLSEMICHLNHENVVPYLPSAEPRLKLTCQNLGHGLWS